MQNATPAPATIRSPLPPPVVDITLDPDSLVHDKSAGNRPARLEHFRDLAVGMFIHWGLDSQLGTVPSHWMIGADTRLVDRFISDYPARFHADPTAPGEWARLARTAGMRYACFTAKHHSGFCMYHTRTTPFNIANTPHGRDLVRDYMDAFREVGVEPGLYFSPLDFYWCRTQGKDLHFHTPSVVPAQNPELMAYNHRQIHELLTAYGPSATLFLDGPPEQLRESAWRLQPDIVVTRGAMETPEQHLPDTPLEDAWEACCTIGDGWSYKPTNDTTKSGTELIQMLIQTRALGGNLLLNVSPDADGHIPAAQKHALEELGTWLFFNGEAIYGVRPWKTPRQGDIWYTRAKDSNTVYAFVTGRTWCHGLKGRNQVVLPGVQLSEQSTVEMVGQCGILEHAPDADTTTRWRQESDGLHIDAMRCYRPYDNLQWPNPVVFRITHPR